MGKRGGLEKKKKGKEERGEKRKREKGRKGKGGKGKKRKGGEKKRKKKEGSIVYWTPPERPSSFKNTHWPPEEESTRNLLVPI